METSALQDEQASPRPPVRRAAKDGFKVLRLLQILGVSVALAAYSSWVVSARDGRTGSTASPRGIPATDIPLIRLAEAKTLWSSQGTVFLDVRSSVEYELGHVAGALNLPGEAWDPQLAALKPRLEAARAVIVYCESAQCAKSYWGALRLRQEGLHQIKIYPEGWNEWRTHGLPRTGSGE